jgi:hypothetical protein
MESNKKINVLSFVTVQNKKKIKKLYHRRKEMQFVGVLLKG